MESDSLFHFISFQNTFEINPITCSSVVGLLVIVLLLIFLTLLSATETVLFSLTHSQIATLKQKKTKQSALILKQLELPKQLLTTLITANIFLKISIIAILCNSVFSITSTPRDALFLIFIFVGISSFLLYMFEIIVPPIVANTFSIQIVLLLSTLVALLEKIFRPLSALLIKLNTLINKSYSTKEISLNEISLALDIASESPNSDTEILESIVNLRNTDVEEIMKPRVDVVSVEISKSFNEIKTKIIHSGYSRIPVYSDTFDNVKGILYIKDLLPHIQKTTFRWQTLIRPPYYVPYTKKIDDLLTDFQKSKIHLAIVIDEYGGTSGIVTLDDILAEIVGDLNDEFDSPEFEYVVVTENVYIFEGKFQLNDFYKVADVEDTVFDTVKGDADTLAGLILELKGDFPQLFEEIFYKNFIFKIEAEDKRRIQKIKVTINK